MRTNQLHHKQPISKRKIPMIVWLLCLFCFNTSLFAQSYIEDAKNLAKLKKLMENQTVKNALESDAFKLAVIKNAERDIAVQQTPNNNSGAVPFPDGVINTTAQTQDSNVNVITNNAAKKLLEKEIKLYNKIIGSTDSYLSQKESAKDATECPDSFEYLSAIVATLEKTNGIGDGTSAGVIGSLLGVSQAEILQGITDWALTRAQEELMQAFLREWLEKLQEDALLQEAFPNSLTMLSTSDLSSVFTDGDTWKATFKQDLDAIPSNIPNISKLALQKLNIDLPKEKEAELISGLTAMTTVFGELNKNKKPDEILLLLAEKTFINQQNSEEKTITDRSIVGLSVFLKAIQQENNGKLAYVLPAEILQLNSLELEMLWKRIYLCQADKLKFAFNIEDEKKWMNFVEEVHQNVQQLKLQIVNASETINNINTLLAEVKLLDDKKFSLELFNSYTLLMFDLVENGMDGISMLTNIKEEQEAVKNYKETYVQGFKYIMLINEGIKTKTYGQVALNTVNFISWLKKYAILQNEAINVDGKAYRALTAVAKLEKLESGIMSNNDIEKLLDEVQKIIDRNLENYEVTRELIQTRLDAFKKEILSDNFVYSVPNVQNLINKYKTFTEAEKREIVKELAAEGLNNFNTSSAAFNKYTKLMASIILAEDSDDIKEALDAVAMRTGGYMVKQQSYFSATVSFYPGIEFGQEQLKNNDGLPETYGTYLGANLPIGVEFAVGMDTKLIGSMGLFIQVLDLGAVLNYSLSNDSDDVATAPEFGFEQVLSPGAYITTHFKNNPITLGFGASYSPSLREITANGVTTQASALQYGVFLAVDLNVFTIFGSRKKLPLRSTSKRQAYGN